jgi:type I restriction enzyme S subunit
MTELPSGWTKSTLGEIGEYLNGRGFKKTEWRKTGRPIIRIQNLTGTSGTFNYFDGEPEEHYIARPGDLLVSWAATLDVFVWSGPEAVVNQHIFKVRSFIDRRFHRYLLLSVLDELRRQTHGSGMVHITKSRFANVSVLVPPIVEQERIVAAIEEQLSRLDSAIVALERVRQNLKRILAAVLQAAVSGRLDGTFDATSSDDPSEWDIVTVGDIAEVSGGITKNPKRLPRANPIPFLRVANVQRDTLDLTDVHEIEVFEGELDKLRLRRGDLLVVEGNGSPDQIGRSAIWDGSIDPCVHQNHLIRIRPGTRVLPAYLNLFWNAPSSVETIRAVASSTSGLYTLSTGKVRSIPVVLPPLAAQGRIVAEVERQLSFVEVLDRELVKACALARSLRSSVLSVAFTGRLTTQDPNDERASVLLERIVAQRASSNGHKPAEIHRQRRRKATA